MKAPEEIPIGYYRTLEARADADKLALTQLREGLQTLIAKWRWQAAVRIADQRDGGYVSGFDQAKRQDADALAALLTAADPQPQEKENDDDDLTRVGGVPSDPALGSTAADNEVE